jgi:2-phosphosulfolactate phosphatase
MDILTFFTPAEMASVKLDSETVVAIDVLRGATTITSALKAGASKIIPVGDLEHIHALKEKLGREDVLLCGSQNGEIIDGFELGNSPLEYTPSKVQRKTLLYCSVNMANALAVARQQSRVLLSCFNNMSAVLSSVGTPQTLLFLCVGKLGRFALEDAVCAGMLIQLILNKADGEVSLNDASTTARYLFYRHHRDIAGMLRQSSHGIFLRKIGFEDDLEYAAQTNIINIVPELSLEKDHILPTVAMEEVYSSL